jgi:UDP-2,4-diacetamido-2,4,6-trideoxy-beta-L-altropyranose hydrolase
MTLARSIRTRGCDVIFITRSDEGHLNGQIGAQGFERAAIGTAATGEAADAAATIEHLHGCDGLIVDHYGLGVEWERRVRPHVGTLAVIDDLARPHECDLLLDQNCFPPAAERYANLVPATATVLLGPQYALLRPQFAAARETLGAARSGVFVFYGGSDETNETTRALHALAGSAWRDARVEVVVGASNPHAEAVDEAARALSRATVHRDIANMAVLMAGCAWALGAGGTTSWERCALGLPALVTVLADNQIEVAENLARAGAIVNLGRREHLAVHDYITAIDALDEASIATMGANARHIVDGEGTERVVEHLLRLL